MLRNDCMHAVPFSRDSTELLRVVALIKTSIIPPPDRRVHTNDAAQGLSVPIFGRRDRIALLT
jgi:hypothetical protein